MSIVITNRSLRFRGSFYCKSLNISKEISSNNRKLSENIVTLTFKFKIKLGSGRSLVPIIDCHNFKIY